ncbi:GAF and ANTAR domain-containing protein [Glaciihabitans sp. dw_435]|uniref:GAF and ANTAR domain-containing protein n=1 Tax=Glaciihabitans sp. dw_435 TaxID=2720081 RepID=UPI001BD339AD|nr:GAF and ANTAR domain-containing protein [Glaciihabitans sp. dw_435]
MNDGDTVNVKSREQKINDAFVATTDALMNDYDIVDLLSTLLKTCTDILGVDAGGILLADSGGDLDLVASTSEEAKVVETIIIAAGAGPCIDCYSTGRAVSVPDITAGATRWPKFHDSAIEQGFRSTYAIPMRLRREVIGVMNLLSTTPDSITDNDADIAQALADIAVLGILHERNFRNPLVVGEQLHLALDTRIIVEQAKGVLAQAEDLTMTDAFNALREYAAAHDLSLRHTAEATVQRAIATADVVAALARRQG